MYMYYIVIDLLWSIIKLGKVTLPLLSPSLSFILPPSHRNASFTYILFLPSHPWVPPWPPPPPHRTPLGQTIKLGLWSQTCFNFHIGEIKGMVHIAQAQLGKWQFEAGAMFYLLCCGCSMLPEFSVLPSQPRSVTLAAWFVFFLQVLLDFVSGIFLSVVLALLSELLASYLCSCNDGSAWRIHNLSHHARQIAFDRRVVVQ